MIKNTLIDYRYYYIIIQEQAEEVYLYFIIATTNIKYRNEDIYISN